MRRQAEGWLPLCRRRPALRRLVQTLLRRRRRAADLRAPRASCLPWSGCACAGSARWKAQVRGRPAHRRASAGSGPADAAPSARRYSRQKSFPGPFGDGTVDSTSRVLNFLESSRRLSRGEEEVRTRTFDASQPKRPKRARRGPLIPTPVLWARRRRRDCRR